MDHVAGGAHADSGNETRFAYASAGVRNLLTIFAALSGRDHREVEAHFIGKGYLVLKRELADPRY